MDKLDMHEDICEELHDLYERKNHDYGDSFGKSFEEYGLVMPCIRLEDKLNRFKTLVKFGGDGTSSKVSEESIRDTLMDLANYALMTVVELDIRGESDGEDLYN